MQTQPKHTLVTGGSRGIGESILRELFQQGHYVHLHHAQSKARAEDIQSELGAARCSLLQADFTQDFVNDFLRYLEQTPEISNVVLNAGVFLSSPIDQNLAEWKRTWKKTMAINLDAVGLLTKIFIENFRKIGGGRLIYIASRAAFKGETEDHLAYAASKGGVVSLARSVARSFGKDGIKSFIVAPGFTRTEMAEEFIAEHGEEAVTHDLALNQLTRPEDIAPLVALMASGKMDHATGSTIDINGGSYIH